jgi:hypothetical protein
MGSKTGKAFGKSGHFDGGLISILRIIIARRFLFLGALCLFGVRIYCSLDVVCCLLSSWSNRFFPILYYILAMDKKSKQKKVKAVKAPPLPPVPPVPSHKENIRPPDAGADVLCKPAWIMWCQGVAAPCRQYFYDKVMDHPRIGLFRAARLVNPQYMENSLTETTETKALLRFNYTTSKT